MSRIDRIRRVVSARKAARTESDRPEAAVDSGSTNLPVAIGPAASPRTFKDERRRSDAEVSAQLMGQDGQRRGLRGGSPVLEAARSAYNRTEWSGSYDRRAGKGRRARTDI